MFKKYSKQIKLKTRNLRNQGWSLGEISLKTDIPKNTVSGWVKDIRLTKKQRKRIKNKEIASAAEARELATKALHKKMVKWKEGVRKRVRYFGRLHLENKETGKLICGLLYLCEGSKYPATRCLVFGNSNPGMIKAFLYLLRKYFLIQDEKLRCRIIPRWDQDINQLQNFWSKITRISLGRFYKTLPDKRTQGKVTRKKGYKGVCVVYYCDTSLQFELQSIGEAIMRGLR